MRQQQVGVSQCAVTALIDGEEDSEEVQHKRLKINTLNLRQTESYEDVHMGEELKHNQRKELTSLLAEFTDMLSDVPGRISAYIYDIKLTMLHYYT